MIFTGSTVIDEHNTSGFCKDGRPCMVAIYTGHTPEGVGKKSLQTQNVAFSNDRGRTWTKYSGNPVLDLHMTDFRDPKKFFGPRQIQSVDHGRSAAGRSQSPRLCFARFESLESGERVRPCRCNRQVNGNALNCSNCQWKASPANHAGVMKVGLNPGALQGGSGEQYFIGQFDGTAI